MKHASENAQMQKSLFTKGNKNMKTKYEKNQQLILFLKQKVTCREEEISNILKTPANSLTVHISYPTGSLWGLDYRRG